MTSSSISNEEVGIRLCILSEFLHNEGKLSIDEVYENLCKEIGHDIITFEDFKFWMNRFENRQFDLGYDRNMLPKPKTFSDLPENVHSEIVQNLDLKSRFVTRKVCRSLRTIADEQPIKLDRIVITSENDKINVNIENGTIRYRKVGGEYLMEFNGKQKKLAKEDYLKTMFNNLEDIFKNSNFELKTFRIHVEPSTFQASKIIEILKHSSSKSKLKVENINIICKDFCSIRTILNCFEPGFSEKISLPKRFSMKDGGEALFEIEQWKMAKSVSIGIFSITKDQLVSWMDQFQKIENLKICRLVLYPKSGRSYSNELKILNQMEFSENLSSNTYQQHMASGMIIDVKIDKTGLKIEKILNYDF